MIRIKKSEGLLGIITLGFFSVYIIIYSLVSNETMNIDITYFLSFTGTCIYLGCIYYWFKKTRKIVDLYTIFITLFFLFNFGQCFLWVFNIHSVSEIGVGKTFGIYIQKKNIILAQLFTLICLISFHYGAVLSIYNIKKKDETIKTNEYTENNYKKNMRIFCRILLIFVVPITYYIQYKKIVLSMQYGYGYLFGGEISFGKIALISRLFFPCIYGLLFASDFKKSTVIWCYILCGINFIMSLLMGTRGSIVYELLIILFLHNRYVRKINLKNIFIYFTGFFIVLSLFSTVKNSRDYGVDIGKLSDLMSFENNVISDSIFEMGGSMGIQCILIQNGNMIYPYGNTFLLGLLGIMSEKVVGLLNNNYLDLNTWFSTNYLDIDYGAGFTMVGEVILNFGPIIGPIIMAIVGFLITKITIIYDGKSYAKTVFSLITFDVFVMFIRGTFGYYIKYWAWLIIMFYGMFYVFNLIMNSKKGVVDNE